MRMRFFVPTLLLALSLALLGALVLSGQQQPLNGAAINPPWGAPQVIHSEDLARMVGNKSAVPQMFNVGFANLYNSKHIPGSIYAGPGRTEEGLAVLRKAVEGLPKDREIVLYCGCCPWDHCPNMKPAFSLLHGMGFSKVRVVEIPTSFAKDWVEKGFPVEGSTAGVEPLR
jgi:thiosulfate/3-mercaptopyruvate sulfurtransferase